MVTLITVRHIGLAFLLIALGTIFPGVSGLNAAPAPPRTVNVDVLVIGGTPAGIAAAAAAARVGARVHIVEAMPKLGGVITWAWLTTFDLNLTPDGDHLTRGIFWEYYQALGLSFDLDEAVQKLTRQVYTERLVGSSRNAPLRAVLKNGRRVIGAQFEDKDWGGRTLTVLAKQIIDATDDGDAAAAAGAHFILGRDNPDGNELWMQAATLIFRLGGVSWTDVILDIIRRRNGTMNRGAEGWNGNAVWAFHDVMQTYKPSQPEDTAVLGLNLAVQRDGTILINGLQIFGVNGLDPASVEEGLAKGKRELPHLVAFLRQQIPAFANATLVDHAPMLYIRETRHIAGLYTLTVEDILFERVFPDRIAVASYPIDIHPYRAGYSSPYTTARRVYTIPYRSMVPQTLDNLQVASRAFSATSEAHGSARVIPTSMAMGQAAGVVAAFCALKGCTPRQVAATPALISRVQAMLRGQGAHLGREPSP